MEIDDDPDTSTYEDFDDEHTMRATDRNTTYTTRTVNDMHELILKRVADMEAGVINRLNRAMEVITRQTNTIADLNKKVTLLDTIVRNTKETTNPQKTPTEPKPTAKPPGKPMQTPADPVTTQGEKKKTKTPENPPKAPKSFADAAKPNTEKEEWQTATSKNKKKQQQQQPSKDAVDPGHPLSARRFVICRSKDAPAINNNQQLVDVRDACNVILKDYLRFHQTGNIVIGVTTTYKGNLLITTSPTVTAISIMEYKKVLVKRLEGLDLSITQVQDVRVWPKVIIHRVDTSAFPRDMEGMSKLKFELESNNTWLKLEDEALPRYLKSAIRMMEEEANLGPRMHTSIIIGCQTQQMADAAIERGLYAWGTRLKATPFHKARPQDMCKRCLGFGHHHEACRKSWACNICSEDHATHAHTCSTCNMQGKLCKCTPAKCYHCAENHLASDPKCVITSALKAKIFNPEHRQEEQTERQNEQLPQPHQPTQTEQPNNALPTATGDRHTPTLTNAPPQDTTTTEC